MCTSKRSASGAAPEALRLLVQWCSATQSIVHFQPQEALLLCALLRLPACRCVAGSPGKGDSAPRQYHNDGKSKAVSGGDAKACFWSRLCKAHHHSQQLLAHSNQRGAHQGALVHLDWCLTIYTPPPSRLTKAMVWAAQEETRPGHWCHAQADKACQTRATKAAISGFGLSSSLLHQALLPTHLDTHASGPRAAPTTASTHPSAAHARPTTGALAAVRNE
jgi:hypothetical protein